MSDFNYQAYLKNNPLLQKEVKEEKLLTEEKKKDVEESAPGYKHDCAAHVMHESHGYGLCLEGRHTLVETTEGHAEVTHYDVMFKSGNIIEKIPVNELKVLTSEAHTHSKYEEDDVTEEETLNEGVLDKLKDKALKIVDKIRSKFSDVEVSKMKAAVKKALGKDKLELSDITLNNLKKVVNVMKDQLAEGQLEESLGDKIKKLAAGTGLLGGFAAAIAGMSLGTLSAPLVIGGLIAMIIGGMIGQDLEEEITEEATSKMTVSELKAKIKEDILSILSEQDEEEDVEVDVEDEVEVDTEEPALDADDAQEGLSADEKEIQDSLKIAYDNAVAIGDKKLADQIGNSITFFTRSHVVER